MHSRKSKKSGQVKQYKVGRICKKFGCKKKLSIYNSTDFCHVHRSDSLK